MEKIKFTRINNDINGNPRFVCHFLNFIKDTDQNLNIYELAVNRAKIIGGKKHHTKYYGGGIVFQSYNIEHTEKAINDLMNNIK